MPRTESSMKLDICRLTMPDKKGVFAYVQNGRWVTIAESGQKVIAMPVLNDNRTKCEFVLMGPCKGSKMHPITDPVELRIAAALIELAQQAFPRVTTKREPKWSSVDKNYTFAANVDPVSVAAWKVATCLLWRQWQSNADTIITRSTELRGYGYEITDEKFKDALKRDSALKLLRESKKK